MDRPQHDIQGSAEVRECLFRHPPTFQAGIAACLHSRVNLPNDLVTADVCHDCTHYCPANSEHARDEAIEWPCEVSERSGRRNSAPHSSNGRSRQHRNCLLVLQPREIPECLESIDSLPIDKAYFRAFTEYQLVVPLNRFIRETNYENYLVVADDVIVSAEALLVVEELLEQHEVATGYCEISLDSPYVNVVRTPLRLEHGAVPVMSDYDFYHGEEIRRLETPTFVTWFGGWALTGIRRTIWLNHPFRVNKVSWAQSDFEWFYRFQRPLISHRDAYIKHLKPTAAGFLQSRFVIGKVPPRVIFRRHHG